MDDGGARRSGAEEAVTSEKGVLRRAFVLVYGTLLILVLMFPGQIQERLADLPEGLALPMVDEALSQVALVSERLGFTAAFNTVRDLARAALEAPNG